jgi:hypothetical protein
MPRLPGWSDTAFRVLALLVPTAVVAVVVGAVVYVRTPYHENTMYAVDQPVEFDHRHHVRDDGIDCLYCHAWATRAATAGVPPTSLCMGCHSQIWQDSPELEPVRRSFVTGQPLRWRRVYQLPGYVYFNHAIHVNKGVGCVECHGRVDQMARVYRARPLTMEWCLKCHRDPAPHLRPIPAITSMASTESLKVDGTALMRRLGVVRVTDCSACHR